MRGINNEFPIVAVLLWSLNELQFKKKNERNETVKTLLKQLNMYAWSHKFMKLHDMGALVHVIRHRQHPINGLIVTF